ncbi:hypothetical protein FRC08_012651 [Ceratobasidium sp. 394]|nr:hypothetical protein FRC08_012651 [Ceratobasidium sp. 394]
MRLAVTDVASNAVRAPTQAVYKLTRNVQDEEPGCWSLIPLPLDAKYGGFEQDQGPDDDVSGTCALGSHVVDTVADPPSSVTITAPGTPEAEPEDSDSTTTRSTDPASVPLPDSEDDDFGPAEDATTVALAVDPATIPLPPDDGLWEIDAEPEPEPISYSVWSSDSILSADLDSSDSLVSDVQTEESSGLGSLSMSEDQSAEFGGSLRFLVEDGTGGASVSASTSLDSDILGELGDAAQEGPAGDARNDNGADGTLDTSVSMSIGNTGMGASTSLDTPGPNTLPIEAAGTSEFPTEDSLDLNLIIESRSQLLDVDLTDLADSGSEMVPDVDWDEEKVVVAKPNAPQTTAPPVSSGFDRSFPHVSVFPNLPTIAEESFGSLANVSPDTTAWELGMPATPTPAEDSMDLKLDTTGSRLMDADFGELEDMSNDFGESVDRSFPRVSALPNLPTIAEESFGSLADISPDTTAWELGMPQTQATSAPAEDSLDLKLDITGSRLLGADFGELEDMSDDFGESVVTGSKRPTGLLGMNTPANSRSTNDNTEDTSTDSLLDTTGEVQETH